MNGKRTDTRREILHFIRDYIQQEHLPPTLKEIATGCHLSVSTVFYHLSKLEASGRLARTPRISRSIRLLDDAGKEEK